MNINFKLTNLYTQDSSASYIYFFNSNTVLIHGQAVRILYNLSTPLWGTPYPSSGDMMGGSVEVNMRTVAQYTEMIRGSRHQSKII